MLALGWVNNNNFVQQHVVTKDTITACQKNQPSQTKHFQNQNANIASRASRLREFTTLHITKFPHTCELPSILLGNDPKLQAMLMKPSSPAVWQERGNPKNMGNHIFPWILWVVDQGRFSRAEPEFWLVSSILAVASYKC